MTNPPTEVTVPPAECRAGHTATTLTLAHSTRDDVEPTLHVVLREGGPFAQCWVTVRELRAALETLAPDAERSVYGVWNGTQNVNWLRQRIRDRWPELGRALDGLRVVEVDAGTSRPEPGRATEAQHLSAEHLGTVIEFEWQDTDYSKTLLGLRPTLLADDMRVAAHRDWISRDVEVLIEDNDFGPQWLDLRPDASVARWWLRGTTSGRSGSDMNEAVNREADRADRAEVRADRAEAELDALRAEVERRDNRIRYWRDSYGRATAERADSAEDALAVERAKVARVEALTGDWPCGDEWCDGDCTGCAYAADLLAALSEPDATGGDR